MTHPTSSPPELLYHYTTASGLLGILEKKALWATDVGYLNDYMEVELSIDELIDALGADYSSREDADPAGAALRSAEASLVDHRGGGRFGPFVASFCESGDQLRAQLIEPAVGPAAGVTGRAATGASGAGAGEAEQGNDLVEVAAQNEVEGPDVACVP